MKKWTLWSFTCFLGIPWFIIGTLGGIYVKYWYCSNYTRRTFRINGMEDVKDILLYAFLFMLFVFLLNLLHVSDKKPIGLFTWLSKYKYEPEETSSRKRKAQYPLVDSEYLSEEPNQMPLGKQNGKYVQFNIDSCLSLLIFGSPGAGKTTLLLSLVLYQLWIKREPGEIAPALFIFDFKGGELYRKSCLPNNSKTRFISLENRKHWGWNPYYRLNANSSDDEVIRELTLLADVIIDSGNDKNAFFTESAKNILIFVGLYDFKISKKKSFIGTIDRLTAGDLSSVLKEVVEDCDNKLDMKKIYDTLAEYVASDDGNEALNNIKMTIKQKTRVFKVDDVRWALEYNPRRASPEDLEKGISLFFYPGDPNVTDVVLKMIAKQLEYHTLHRDYMNLKGKGPLRNIVVVADECYTIGKAVDYTNWASKARAYKTTLIMIWQSFSQIKEIFGNDKPGSLLDDVDGIAVLAVNSPQNAEQFVDFAGQYFEEKRSISEGSSEEGKSTLSYEDKHILTKQDFLTLKKNKEVILLMNGKYFRVDSEAARYYKIPELKEISDKCLKVQMRYEGKPDKEV